MIAALARRMSSQLSVRRRDLVRALPFRFDIRPAKQLHYFFLQLDIRKLGRHEQALDAPCGDMDNRKLIDCERYIGLDLDEEVLAKAASRNPSAIALHRELLDLPTVVAEHGQSQLVLCTQTIGVNQHFDMAQAPIILRHLIDATDPGGTLIVNLGDAEGRLEETEAMFLEVLREEFDSVIVRHYGALQRKVRLPLLASPLLALFMLVLPPLRHGFGRAHRKSQLTCRVRRARG